MSETQPIEAHTDRNVYILGAGFSADAGLPLIAGFMNRMRDSVAWLKAAGRDEEVKAIRRVLAFRLKAASAAYHVDLNAEDIEELFSLASAREGESLARDVTLAIAATLDFAGSATNMPDGAQFNRKKDSKLLRPERWKFYGDHGTFETFSCPLYDLYVGIMTGYFSAPSLERRDTIITFNYDLLAENGLAGLGTKFSYGFDESEADFADNAKCQKTGADSIRVLKLHGSVNWAAPAIADKKPTVYGGYADLRVAKQTPLLAPPTWRKVYSGVLSKVWDGAVAALDSATNVIILAYSIPPTDRHFKYLIAAGLQENISLRKVFFVNYMAPALGARIQSVFRREEVERQTIELMPDYVLNFFNSQGRRETINRNFGGNFALAP